jgi:hypothetical protein
VSRFHRAARGYGARGLAIFPLEPSRKTPFPGSRGHLEATARVAQIDRWWGACPEANLGFVPASAGWLAFDIDSPDAEAMRARWGLETPALQVQTAAGTHDYWRAPADVEIPGTWEGVIIRHARGYVLLPPSRHPSGVVYRWAIKGRPAALPSLLLAAWAERADAKARLEAPATAAPTEELERRAAGFARRFADTAVGQRHAVAFRFAAFLRDLGASPEEAQRCLETWNAALAHPLAPRELARQCRYGFRAGRRGSVAA